MDDGGVDRPGPVQQDVQARVHARPRDRSAAGQVEVDAEDLDLVGEQARQVRIRLPRAGGGGPGERLERFGSEQADQFGTGCGKRRPRLRDPAVGRQRDLRPAGRPTERAPGGAAPIAPAVRVGAVAAGGELGNVHIPMVAPIRRAQWSAPHELGHDRRRPAKALGPTGRRSGHQSPLDDQAQRGAPSLVVARVL